MVKMRAAGGPAAGPVHGPGGTTDDRAGLFALSNKEWVIRAKSAMKYGFQKMRSVNEGTAEIIPNAQRLAKGGPARINLNTVHAFESAQHAANSLTKVFGAG